MDDELRPQPIGGEIELVTSGGKLFRMSDHRDELKLLYFGYTTCPDACPTALGRIAAVDRRLRASGKDAIADRLLVLFVSIDPERDSAEKLGEYLSFFGVRGVGLVGDDSRVAALARLYGASYRRVDGRSAAGALFDHTTYLYLIDRQGTVRRIIGSGDSVERIADWIAALDARG